MTQTKITVETLLKAKIEQVWETWTQPEHITQWYFASDDWHAPAAENDLKPGGKFKTKMAAKDGSFSFDFEGVYSRIESQKVIEYGLADGREVSIRFEEKSEGTGIIQSFDPENENSTEMQKAGWQAILDNFKKYTESIFVL